MPQRNVASNFTFEQQRVEINNLAQDFWTQKGTVDTAASTYLKHDGSNDFTGQTLAVPNAFTINSNSGNGTVTISGNLDVTGTTTTVSSANLEVTDKNILIAKGSTSDAQADGAGITIDSATDITFNFVDAKDALVSSIGLEGTTFLKAPYGQFTGSGTATVGQGVEINAPDANTGQIISYDRANTAYKELRVKGSSVGIYGGTSNALVGTFNSTGLTLEAGSLIIPDSILHGGDTNTKIRFPSDDTIAFETGGSERFSISDYLISVQSGFQLGFLATSGPSPSIKSGGTDNQSLFLTTGTGNNARVTIAPDGKTSVGTAQTTHTFGITGGSSNQLLVTGTEADIWLTSTGGSSTTWRILGSTGGSTHQFRIYDNTGGADRLTIDSTGKVDVTGELGVGSSIGINGSGGSAYPLHVYSGQKYLVGLKNTAANSGNGYPWLVNDSTDGGQNSLVIHFNGIGDRFYIRENGTAQSTGAFTTSQLIATQGATTEFIQATSTNNGTRAAGSFEGKDSSGNSVTLKFGGYGDTGRGEIFTHSNHPLGFATNNAAAQMVLQTTGDLTVGTATAHTGARLTSDGDIKMTQSTNNTRRIFALPGTGAYALNSSGGAAIAFTRDGSNNDTISFETHAQGASHAIRLTIDQVGNTVPGADNAQDLGSSSLRWANVYTGDMHLNNMNSGGNEVDGSEGHWTMQEGSDDLFLINRNTGKKYKFNLTEVS